MSVQIIKGTFAIVSRGNVTQGWMIDGDDLQARANAAMNPYWGNTSSIIERGIPGYGIQVEGIGIIDVYEDEDSAKARLARIGKA